VALEKFAEVMDKIDESLKKLMTEVGDFKGL
jgi:hypothetical protein